MSGSGSAHRYDVGGQATALKSIANNAESDVIFDEKTPKEPSRVRVRP